MSEVRVVKSTGSDEDPDLEATVDPGEMGEVIIRGPGTCDSYMGRREETEWLLVDDKWIRTGDVAEVDEDGYLYITSRVDNIFVCGGENSYPEEVEEVVETHEAIDEVVVGLEDEQWGQCVACPNADGLTEDDLDEFCREHDQLPNFKRPREYVLTEEELPRTDTGTVQRETVQIEFFAE